MPIKTFGTMGVDWEERVHFDRLRAERLARIRAELQKSEIGALLCFDMANIRYITNTTIGTWAVISTLRGAMPPGSHRAEDVAHKIRVELEARGLHKEPLGVDVIELPVL